MKYCYFTFQKIALFWNWQKHVSNGWMLAILMLTFFSISSYSQKKGGTKGSKDIVVRACTQYIGNGLYRVNFGYDNPNKKEIVVAEDNSYVVSGNGKRKSKGINSFKKGGKDKAFTMEFGEKETVEWTVINPSGKVHTVVANANSSHCPEEEEGFIFPVVGQGNGKYFDLIGMNLGSLTAGNAGDIPSEIIFQISEDGQKVMIVIVPWEGKLQQVMDMLQNKYAVPLSDFLIDPVKIISKNLSAIDVYFPISELDSLNTEGELINFARSLFRPFLDSELGGTVVSQGDSVQRSNIVRDSYRMVNNGELVPVDGRGINIGAFSNSFDTQPFTGGKSKGTIDAEQGDLPNESPVEVFKEYPYGIASDEGRAMLHIVHDIAPGSRLGFHAGLTPRDIELGVNAFGESGYHIVFDDLTFITEPFFGGGRTAEAIQLFTSKPGRSYFSSAGNFGNQASQAIFKSSSSAPVTNFLSSSIERAHVFNQDNGSEDILQKFEVTQPGTFLIVLQWDEGMASQENSIGAKADLDIYIVDDFGNLIVGNNRINDDGDATEILVFQATGVGDANIMITSANGAPDPNLAFRYIVFRSNGLEFLENFGAPTISGHAMQPEVRAIAAVNYENSDNPVPEFYSSYGGLLLDGFNAQVTLSAPDGVHTNVASIGQYKAGDKFTSFFGTSASVGHAAATMALLMSAQPSWYPDGLPSDGTSLTNSLADQAMQLFKQNATPAGDPDRAGAGFLNAEKAFKQIATQTPKLKVLNWDDGITPSAEPFEVTIIGDYFPSEPTVLFDGVELEIVSSSGSEIVAKVPVFTGNPGVQVSAGSITPNTEAQAISDPLTFLEDGKLAINVIAKDFSVEFGNAVNVTFNVEGLPEGETLESQGLPELKFSTAAVFPYPDVNNYVITPYFEGELSEDHLNTFHINYISGILSVTKKQLSIKPDNATYIYGEAIDVVLNYGGYNLDEIIDPENFQSTIQNSHKSDFFLDNPLILINNFSNEENRYEEILSLLENGSWISSERAIENGRPIALANFILLDVQHFIEYIDRSIVNGRPIALANASRPIALANAEDLLSGLVDLSIENSRPIALANSSGLGDDNDLNDYTSVFSLIDIDDAPTDDDPTNSISKFYALNLLTGKEVTDSTPHFVYPGAFLHPMSNNFNITYEKNSFFVSKATLNVSIMPDNMVITQGDDIYEVTSLIEGFVWDEKLEDVFPDDVEYYFIDESGDEYEDGDVGVFRIMIREPKNYKIVYNNDALLYINPLNENIKKVRTYADCVTYDLIPSDGLNYSVIFRYENDNPFPLYVLGEDNSLSGPSAATSSGELPIIFMPGSGVFEIRFDGNRLIWKLRTSNTIHSTSVSSESTSESGKCAGKIDTSYEVFPNPVGSNSSYMLTIKQNIIEDSTVNVINMYGANIASASFDGSSQTIQVDMQSYPTGMYIVRIVSQAETRTFNIIKE